MDNERKGELTLLIKNKKIKLLFGMLFWKFLQDLGVKLQDLEHKLSDDQNPLGVFDTIAKIIYSAGWVAAKKEGKEFKYTEDEIFEWFEDDITQQDIQMIVEGMMNSRILGKSLNDGIVRGKKTPKKTKK